MAPKSDIEVACDAMRSDAKKWATGSEEMMTAATSAKNLVLGRQEFGHRAETLGLVAAYTTLQQHIAHLLAGAHDQFGEVSDALNWSADTYEFVEAQGAHNFRKIK